MFEATELPEEKEAFYQLLNKQAQALMIGEGECIGESVQYLQPA